MPVMNAAMALSRELSLFQPGRDRNLLVFEGPRGNLGNSLSTHFLVFNGCVCVCVCACGKRLEKHASDTEEGPSQQVDLKPGPCSCETTVLT